MLFLKGAWNGIGGFIAVVLSIALILVLLALPAMFTAQMALEPGNLQEIMLMMTAKIEPSTDPQEVWMREMMQTETARDLIGLYKDDLLAQMRGEESPLNAEALVRLAHENMDELIPMFRNLAELSGTDLKGMTDAQLKTGVEQMMGQYGAYMLEELPTAKQLGLEPLPELASDNLIVMDGAVLQRLLNLEFRRADLPVVMTQMMTLLNDYLGLKLLGLVAAGLSLLVIFFRLGKGFRGFSWLGTDYLIGGGLGLTISLGAMSLVRKMLLGPNAPPVGGVLQGMLKWFAIGSAVVLALGILFAVIASVGNNALEKRRKK